MLSPTVLPIGAAPDIRYSSANPRIAEINAFGRVTAISTGITTITISADGVRAQTIVTVIDETKVTEIDLDYKETMLVGTSQVIFPSLLPAEATADIFYSSSDTKVAVVNIFCRITALSSGEATITIASDTVKMPIIITVIDEIKATGIDFDYNDIMTVGTSQILSLTVLPAEAVPKITYSSVAPGIAEVNDFGRTTAISSGTTAITISTDDVEKHIYVATERIDVADIFITMQPSNAYEIIPSVPSVFPENADQNMTFISTNDNIASVNENGVVTAHSPGRASIIASNFDSSTAITIVVNEGSTLSDMKDEAIAQDPPQGKSNSHILASQIHEALEGATISVNGSDYTQLNADVVI